MSVLTNAKMLVSYKAWSNDLVYSSVSKIPEEELLKERKTTFKTMLSTLNHIRIVDLIFKAHLTGEKHGYTARNTPLHPGLSALWKRQKEINCWYIDYVARVSEETFATNIDFEFVGGGKAIMTPNEMILHIVNHGTNHCGYVFEMMYQVPSINPDTDIPANDISVFLRDN